MAGMGLVRWLKWHPAMRDEIPSPVVVVDVAASLLRQNDPEARKRAMPFPMVLDGLHMVAAARARLDEDEETLIREARERGHSWQSIAEAMGLDTRQAAQQRYERLRHR